MSSQTVSQSYHLSVAEYRRRSELTAKLCKLGYYTDPDAPIDFASFGLPTANTDTPRESDEQALLRKIRQEEENYSACFKHVLQKGR